MTLHDVIRTIATALMIALVRCGDDGAPVPAPFAPYAAPRGAEHGSPIAGLDQVDGTSPGGRAAVEPDAGVSTEFASTEIAFEGARALVFPKGTPEDERAEAVHCMEPAHGADSLESISRWFVAAT
jgi:hypothetical protein